MGVDYGLMPDLVAPPSEWGNAVGVTTESATMQFLARPSGAGASLSPISSRMQDRLRRRLGLKPKDWVLERSVRINGWIATGIVTLIAALTRLIGLGHPDRLMFDEIYYVKDAYALWHNGYESVWSDNADELFSRGDFSALTHNPAYIVHPQLGKWLIGLGMKIFGPSEPFGWRFIPAIAGILTVFLLARLTMRLTHSPLLAGLAGFLLAIDGTGITESRIGLLDIFIGFFALLSVYFLVRDREWFRARLAAGLEGTRIGSWAPLPLVRPWLLATGVSLGLTCSIKWSGAYLLAAVGILTVVWDMMALRRVRARKWFLDGILHRSVLDFLHLVPVAFVVYVLGWWSWFIHDRAFYRNWAATQRDRGELVRAWLPDSLNSLFEYHRSMYNFHTHLKEPHPYMSKPIEWLVQWRPTSFYWPDERRRPMRDRQMRPGHYVDREHPRMVVGHHRARLLRAGTGHPQQGLAGLGITHRVRRPVPALVHLPEPHHLQLLHGGLRPLRGARPHPVARHDLRAHRASARFPSGGEGGCRPGVREHWRGSAVSTRIHGAVAGIRWTADASRPAGRMDGCAGVAHARRGPVCSHRRRCHRHGLRRAVVADLDRPDGLLRLLALAHAAAVLGLNRPVAGAPQSGVGVPRWGGAILFPSATPLHPLLYEKRERSRG